jgi:hypothetical protein
MLEEESVKRSLNSHLKMRKTTPILFGGIKCFTTFERLDDPEVDLLLSLSDWLLLLN